MTTITVKTQAELDDALATHGADRDAEILIDSPKNIWLEVRAYGSARVYAYDSASVRAYNSASVTAHGSANVQVYGSARVVAYGAIVVVH